jgi:hypothetical protein
MIRGLLGGGVHTIKVVRDLMVVNNCGNKVCIVDSVVNSK